jgi:hypothetical protein
MGLAARLLNRQQIMPEMTKLFQQQQALHPYVEVRGSPSHSRNYGSSGRADVAHAELECLGL